MVAGCVALLVVLGALASAFGDREADETPEKRPPPAQEKDAPAVTGERADVEITSCGISPSTSWPKAEIRITNHSSKTSDYWINVEFVDARGERFAEGFVTANNLDPGKVSRESASGFTEAPGSVTCRVTEVERWASS
ncbi:hypothetical protein ACIBI4_06255 [Streptomyces sp. NPDC050418]|uniref:hypothetical protein n=1 Tax=Streptomyces sp. NPDC050418 TaxID=3365612 RepID=UPI0037B635E0